MRFQGWQRLRDALILLYSFAIMATVIPGFSALPHTVIIPYFIFIPGYVFSLAFRQSEGITQTIFYSLVWSVAALAGVYSVLSLTPRLSTVPLSGVIPTMTIILLAYAFYHRR